MRAASEHAFMERRSERAACGSQAPLFVPAIVSGRDDFAMVREAIEERGGARWSSWHRPHFMDKN
jgi:hypothetical protein